VSHIQEKETESVSIDSERRTERKRDGQSIHRLCSSFVIISRRREIETDRQRDRQTKRQRERDREEERRTDKERTLCNLPL
jgi:hypothetical protein